MAWYVSAFINLWRLPSASSPLVVVTSAEAAATATAPAAADPMAPATLGSLAETADLGSEERGVADLEEVEVKCNN